ncbi:glycosyltransferase family 2 protein [Pedobacter sp. JY14-1]|uniref:glycosyltransferase family 2 protein n=1 Tax=Pedobacter sp. JY14-1 TaxID=3034151 RepID=UPI0023E11A21|nr:glycosyltransferase family 2 protein [Pedobacter sp. JY14-1]
MSFKVCIATTIKGCPDNILETWVLFHKTIGFDHFFLVYDDPDEIPSKAAKSSNVTTLRKSDFDQDYLNSLDTYKNLKDYTESDLIARQVINMSNVIKIARDEGYDWILHIDVDEIFWCRNWQNVKNHFYDLQTNGIDCINYVNYEAIPNCFDVENYFEVVTTFKKNQKHLTHIQNTFLQENGWTASNYFNFYGNGKSAARLTQDVQPVGPHYFSNHREFTSEYFPVILHYPICGFQNFFDKYKILGNFPDLWLGTYEIKKLLPFHLASRDAVNKHSLEYAIDFYRQRVLKAFDKNLKELIDIGIVCQIRDVQEVLFALKKTKKNKKRIQHAS